MSQKSEYLQYDSFESSEDSDDLGQDVTPSSPGGLPSERPAPLGPEVSIVSNLVEPSDLPLVEALDAEPAAEEEPVISSFNKLKKRKGKK